MSAFIVDVAHIDYLLTAALEWGRRDPLRYTFGAGWHEWEAITLDTADRVGADLLRENVASVSYRYDAPLGNLPGTVPNPDPAAYVYRRVPARRITDAQVAKAIACYEYQSSEHPGWPGSAAYQFCRSVEKCIMERLPGYDAAQWELRGEDVHALTEPSRG